MKWEFGEPPGFWMENNPPTQDCWSYTFECREELGYSLKQPLLDVLDALGVIRFGCVYETVEAIRIKV